MGRKVASSIHLLPREADAAVAQAIDAALVSRNKTQIGALADLNQALARIGAGPIAKSSWARFLSNIDESGIPARWRTEKTSPYGDEVILPRARYTELLEAEAAFLKHKLARQVA